MQRYHLTYIRLLSLAMLMLLLAGPPSETQGQEFSNNCLQEMLLEAEDGEHCLHDVAGVKTNAGCRVMPSPVQEARQGAAGVVVRPLRPEASSGCLLADKCHLYCTYRL